MEKKWEIKDEAVKKRCFDELITRIEEVDDGMVGFIAAQDIADIVTEYVGPIIYNAGVQDTRKLLLERLADLEIDIDLLEKPIWKTSNDTALNKQ